MNFTKNYRNQNKNFETRFADIFFLILGNKGGVAIRLEYERTSLCFVSSHLAAHTDGTEKRNKDYQEICKNLIFDGLAITDHDMVFWMGDLNYRYCRLGPFWYFLITLIF